MSVKGRNLRLVNALSFALPYDPKDLEFVGVEVKNMKNRGNLTKRKMLEFKARRDMKFQPKLTDGMVVDKKLNTKKL